MFILSIAYSSNAPFLPPKISFLTKIFHPNISEEGEISVDFLSHNWSPALTMPKVLFSLQSLLSDPNPEDPLNQDAGRLMLEDYQQFDSIAVDYKLRY
mmetsp:Transcript_33424/g.38391  ORF Transcript_33424/g.38391 Transcript_33424/m.38391 type:complete len:98 (-) Transcript_33424:26-319(-)